MRLLLEAFIVAALIYLGWATPLRDYLPASISGLAKSKSNPSSAVQSQSTATAATQPQPQPQPIARSRSTPSGAWMWDPNHRGALDRPTPKPTHPH